jgi:phosphoenolpyruvate---glycerone phosphotransferase subunit DhaK
MKKLINDPDSFVDEVVDGLLLAHPGQLRAATKDGRALVRADAPVAGHVGIVTGGGSGHLPAFLGYVGVGLCSGVAVGNVFSSPSAEQMHEATKAVDGGAGVLYLYGNYGGDVFNFDLAGDLAELDGIETRTVLVTDDALSAPPERRDERRGVAGMVFAFKVAGASAERGDNLDRVTELAMRAVDATRTVGVGLSPTILPAAGKPTFELGEGEMEIGIGIHGEPGRRRVPLAPADEIAEMLVTPVVEDLPFRRGDQVLAFVNGMGGTPLTELYIVFRAVYRLLEGRGITVARSLVGNYITSLEMAGTSVSLLRLDDQMIDLWDAPVHTAALRWGV